MVESLFWALTGVTYLVGWASSCKVKGRQFDSWLGHMPGLRVQFPVRVYMRGSGLMFLTLSFLPSSLKINK